VQIDVRDPIDDPRYGDPFTNEAGFHLEAGTHHMDGPTAMAYARSRHAPGDDDFVRAGRQQRLLNAIRARVDEIGLVSALPAVLDLVDRHVRTDISTDDVPRLAQTVLDARWSALRREVLDPPDYVTPAVGPDGAYVLRPDLAAIRTRTAELINR